jgi:hypothetical protein
LVYTFTDGLWKERGLRFTAEEPVWNREKGELRIFGRRNTAIDAQALCDYLDSLVGVQVGEVIMNNLESRSGKQDADWIRKEKPELTTNELIKFGEEWDRIAGVGATHVTLSKDETSPIVLEISNPSVKGTQGAAKAFLFSWWAGMLSSLLGRNFEYKDVVYDREKNLMKCVIVPRETV